MKKLYIYYSLTGNGELIANTLRYLNFDIRRIEPRKKLPKNKLLQILIGGYKAMKNMEDELLPYNNDIKLHVIKFTDIQTEILKKCPRDYLITIMRRMMYRITERVARMNNCKIIVNGESIGQVASQTLTSMNVINEVVRIPVIRPVACFDKLEIIDIAKKIDTYETSILPYEDCCTIFVPKHPVINPHLSKCLEYESLVDYESLINEAIEGIITITVNNEEEFSGLL